MPKRLKRKEVVEEVAGEVADVGGTVFDSMRDDAYVMVWRRSEQSKRMVYMGRLAPSEATEEVISKALGGGYYTLREKYPNEGGAMVFGRQRTIELGGPRKINGTLEGIGEGPQSPATAAAVVQMQQGVSPQQLLDSAMVSTVVDLLKATKETKAGPDITDLLKPIMDSQARMIEAMMTVNQRPPAPVADPVDIFKVFAMVKDMMPQPPAASPADPSSVLMSIVKAIRQLRAAADDIKPDEEDRSDPMTILAKGMEVILEEHKAKKERMAGRVLPLRPRLPQGETPAVATDSNTPVWQRILRREGPRLVKFAQANRNAELVAGMALDFAPPNIQGALVEFFSQETDIIKSLVLQEVPGLQPYSVWLNAFIEAAQDAVIPEDDDIGEGEGTEEGGDGGDSSEGS